MNTLPALDLKCRPVGAFHAPWRVTLSSAYFPTLLKMRGAEFAGKKPVLPDLKLSEFKSRLGIRHRRSSDDVAAMTTEQFLKMEQLLLEELGVQPRVVMLVMEVVRKQEPVARMIIEAANSAIADSNYVRNRTFSQTRSFYDSLKEGIEHDLVRNVSRDKIAGLITVISNTGVFFTTRDWNVTGVISAMCGGLAIATPSR
ncbi:MAG: hypothetical protein ACKVP4_09855 [Hyphomicrobium sp.]